MYLLRTAPCCLIVRCFQCTTPFFVTVCYTERQHWWQQVNTSVVVVRSGTFCLSGFHRKHNEALFQSTSGPLTWRCEQWNIVPLLLLPSCDRPSRCWTLQLLYAHRSQWFNVAGTNRVVRHRPTCYSTLPLTTPTVGCLSPLHGNRPLTGNCDPRTTFNSVSTSASFGGNTARQRLLRDWDISALWLSGHWDLNWQQF